MTMKRIMKSIYLWTLISLAITGLNAQSSQTGVEGSAEVIRATAKYMSNGGFQTDQVLKEVKFTRPPSLSMKEWNSMPDFSKIKLAYSAAENKATGGGKKFLALLSKNLAQNYESVKLEPALKKYVNMSVDNFQGFSKPSQLKSISLPDDIQKTISKVSKYTRGNRLGGLNNILKVHFGLTNKQVGVILNTAGSYEDAMKMGYDKMHPPSTKRAKLSSLVKEVQSSYSSAKSDVTLKQYISQTDRTATGNRRSNTNSRSSDIDNRRAIPTDAINRTNNVTNVKPSHISEGRRIQNLRSFEQRANITDRASRSFRRVIRNSRSFGGVVFGNDVKVDSSISNINFIRWVPSGVGDGGGKKGYIEFNFESEEKFFGPVYEEDFYAAFKIWYGSKTNDPLQDTGEAVGLVGIHDPEDIDEVRIWNVIINPYIADLELGWSALLADALPICETSIYHNVKKFGTPKDLQSVEDFYESEQPNTWKIIDVPTKVTSEGNRINIEPTNDIHDDGVFLSMQAFYGFFSDESTENITFHKVVPVLSNAFYEFYRMNEFAQTFSILQFAKDKGIIVAEPPVPQKVNIPTKLIIDYKKKEIVLPNELEKDFTIFFDFNDFTIHNTSYNNPIKKIIELYRINPNIRVKIVGHTDDVGSDLANIYIGFRRAKEVRKKLIEKGIPQSSIQVFSRGESDPIKNNSSETNRSFNRRADVYISFIKK